MRVPAERGLVRDSLVYAVGLALQRGLSVLVLPAATRILEPEAVGVASAALAVGAFLAVVLALGFPAAVMRLWYDEPPDADRTAWAALVRVQLLLAGALAGAAWLAGPWWSRMYDDVPWSGALQAAVVLAFAQASQSTALGVLRAARRVGAFTAVVAVQVGAGGGLSIWLADQHGPGGLVAGLAAGATAGALLGAVLTYRRPSWSRPAVRAGVTLAVPFLAHLVSAWVLSLSDRVLVERFLDLERLAAYHVAYALGSLPILLTDAVQSAWVPRFYALGRAEKQTAPRRLVHQVTPPVGAMAVGVVLLAPLGARVLAPPEFDVPMTVVALVVAATVVRASYLVGFGVLSDRKLSAPIAKASATGAVLNLALNLALIPVWGLNAAAATTLVAYAAMSVMVVRSTERVLGEPLDLARLAWGWAATVAVALAASALPTDGLGWALRLVVLVGGAAWWWRTPRTWPRREGIAAAERPRTG